MNRRELRRRLNALGRQPTPGPSPSFVSSLGDRLRLTGPGPAARSGLRRRIAVGLSTVAAAALVVAAVLVASPSGGSLTLLGASDAVVELPDGTQVEAREGLGVPDGSTIRTGPDGRVDAGGVVLGPGGTAFVRDGRLVVAAAQRSPTPPPTREPTPRPTREPAPSPEATRSPRPSPTASPEADDRALELRCRADRVDDRPAIRCDWSSVDAAAGYRLWRADGTRRVVFESRDRRRYDDLDVTPGVTYTYRAEALDASGRVIAASALVRQTAGR